MSGVVDAADLSCVVRAPRFSTAIHQLLHQESVERWSEGWALAERLGPAVVPALQTVLRQEANLLKRLVLIGALAAASRTADADPRLLEIAAAKPRGVEEATLVLMCLAVAPLRSRSAPELEQIYAEERAGGAVSVAAALASARYAPAATATARADNASARPALPSCEQVALAVRRSLPFDALRRAHDAVRQARGAVAASVVLRAALLGRGGKPSDELEGMARDLVQQANIPREVRVAAALYLGAAGARLDGLVVSDAHARAALAAVLATQKEPRRPDLLDPSPEILIEPRNRLFLVTAYALATPWSTIAADREKWSREPALTEAVVLALAWRVLARDDAASAIVARITSGLSAGPAAVWWQLATGARVERTQLTVLDAGGSRVAALALDGCADRPVIARQIESALWRAGAHPNWIGYLAWADLVRDALLAGSDEVSARLQSQERPPLPRGIESSNAKFFQVADRLFRFLTERVPEPPPELRLR